MNETQWLRRLNTAAALLAAGAFCVAVSLAYKELRHINDDRKVLKAFELSQKFDAPDILHARSRLALAIMNEKPLARADVDTVLGMLDTIGYFTHRGYVDERLLWNEVSEPARVYWLKLSRDVQRERTAAQDPTLYEEAEWLQRRMTELEAGRRSRQPDQLQISDERALRFLALEVDLKDAYKSVGAKSPRGF